ncbi:MAG TPA: heavy metal-associated domain-containing protein, partial [Thermoanaerobaculia bacterium]
MNRESTRETTIPLRSLRCRACAYRLLRKIRRIEGVRDARVDALPTAAIVRHDRALDPEQIAAILRAGGADPSAAEIALPVTTAAGAEEAARSIERELAAVDGIEGAAADLVRNEVRVIHVPAAISADAVRQRIAAFGWSPSQPSGDVAADPAQKAGARRALLRAAVATLAAVAVTVLGALTGPGALAPFLHLVPGSDAALRRWIALGPAAALWATAAVALAAIAWCGAEMFRRAAGDLRRMLVTGRVLAALAVATLTVVSIWGAANTLLGRPAPPLLFGAAIWSLAVVSWTQALTLGRSVRLRNRDASADEHLRNALAAAAWHRSRAEEGSLRHARWWALASLVAAAVAAGAWLFAGASWSLASLAAAAVLLAAAPASFIPAAARPAREAIGDLAKRGVSI